MSKTTSPTPVYMAGSLRVLVNVEAMNMAESVGNLMRHKRAPVAVPVEREDGGKTLVAVTVPVISGQSIAHGYQEVLAKIAMNRGLPVCPLCAQGIFVKHASDQIIKRLHSLGAEHASKLTAKLAKDDPCSFERIIVENCVVEDVGGFLFASGGASVRRTSRIEFSYMIPSLQYVRAVGTGGILHARQDPGAGEGQMLYVIEAGSALYTFSFVLNASEIGMVKCGVGKQPGIHEVQQRIERLKAALDALIELIEGVSFGAKRSRILPSFEVESLVVTVSTPHRFIPTPGHNDEYITSTLERCKGVVNALGGTIHAYYYINERVGLTKEPSSSECDAERLETPADVLRKARDHVISLVAAKQ